MPLIRLQKFLSMAGVCSRRHGERFIMEGKVAVNGKPVIQLGTSIDPNKDRITVDGKIVSSQTRMIYIALHKPKGYITSCHHPGKKIVLDLLPIKQRIFPVGRLDKDSTGLLLLTNDGRLHQRLSHPSYNHEKEYIVTVKQPISDRELTIMADGMKILGKTTRPAQIKRLSDVMFGVILQEGRNRQIRRMVQKIGNKVKELKRIRITHIHLGNLKEGQWRFLASGEVKLLMLNTDKKRSTSHRDAEKKQSTVACYT